MNQSLHKTNRSAFYMAAILILVASVFSNSLTNQFTNWDDPIHVSENPEIKSLSSSAIQKMFEPSDKYMYHPLTILSYAVNYKLSKLDPKAYHFTNLIFHLVNVILVFILLNILFGNKSSSLLGTLLFAIHPIVTEPVDWISGRKDVLFAFFFLLSLLSYLQYVRSKKVIQFAGCFVFFLLSMLSKPMAATLPVVLLLLDYFLDRKISKGIVFEKIALLVVGGIILLIPILYQKDQPPSSFEFTYSFVGSITPLNRVFLSANAISFYAVKSVWPSGLCAFHGFPDDSLPFYYYATPILLVGTVILVYRLKRFKTEVTLGLLFYLVTILPVVHIISFGTNNYLAERYAYIPILGLIFILTGIHSKISSLSQRNLAIGVIGASIIFSLITFRQNRFWKNSIAIWNRVLEVNPDDFYGYFNRGVARKELMDYAGAIADDNRAIEIRPAFTEAWINRGDLKYKTKDLQGAIDDFSKAIKLNPKNYTVWVSRGNAKTDLGKFEEAINDYSQALLLNPDFIDALANRGNSKAMLRDYAGSIEDFNNVIRLTPGDGEAFANRGLSKYYLDDKAGACSDWQTAKALGNKQAAEMIQRLCN